MLHDHKSDNSFEQSAKLRLLPLQCMHFFQNVKVMLLTMCSGHSCTVAMSCSFLIFCQCWYNLTRQIKLVCIALRQYRRYIITKQKRSFQKNFILNFIFHWKGEKSLLWVVTWAHEPGLYASSARRQTSLPSFAWHAVFCRATTQPQHLTFNTSNMISN